MHLFLFPLDLAMMDHLGNSVDVARQFSGPASNIKKAAASNVSKTTDTGKQPTISHNSPVSVDSPLSISVSITCHLNFWGCRKK
jgi:hypothetical protein